MKNVHIYRLPMLGAVATAIACGDVPESAPDAGGDADTELQALTVATDELAHGATEVSYEFELAVTGGSPPYRWSTLEFSVPGLSISSSGTIAGTPTRAGSYDVTLTVTDDTGASETKSFTLLVSEPRKGLVQISAGTYHTCALDHTRVAWCWGANTQAQLGRDTGGEESSIPLAVAGDHRFTAIAAGGHHTCALDEDGAAWCWGAGASKLGDGSEEVGTPVAVPGNHRFTSITAGASHACALDEDRAAWCWGSNYDGALGHGDEDAGAAFEPLEVSGDHRFYAITSAGYHTCAIGRIGAAWCWGANDDGQLGNDAKGVSSFRPVAVEGDLRVTSIGAGTWHTCAIDKDGAAWCWGSDGAGQLGDGEEGGKPLDQPIPQRVGTDEVFATIEASGADHSCALEDSGAAWCWGDNYLGQLGSGGRYSTSIPRQVAGQHPFVSLAGGDEHTCGIDERGVTWCWGANRAAQLGNATAGERAAFPVPVTAGSSAPDLQD